MAPPVAIDAPYNFVPLAKWVHCPDWADQVSHDLPFADGVSGHLDLTITAHTPLLVGGKQNKDVEPGEVYPFQMPNGSYAIPGTSLKGMIRAVVEIASFSRMSLVDERRLGVRDLTPAAKSFYGQKMTKNLGNDTFQAKAKAGWLTFDADKKAWLIRPCHFSRVEQSDLDRFATNNWFKTTENERKTAKQKYKEWRLDLQVQFDPEPELEHAHTPGKLVYSKAKNLGHGKTQGTLVFTGQPSSNKHLEFIFYGSNGPVIEVPEKVFQGFLDIHNAKTEHSEHTAWDDWRGKDRVPVFYLEESSQKGTVASLGLALMYKLAYKLSVHDAIKKNSCELHLDDSVNDMATLIFGRVGDTAEQCLKGRVTFHHAIAHGKPESKEQPATILNGPKPTYYPNYIRQPAAANNNRIPENGKYVTLMDDNCEIRGWKRYPVRPLEQAQVQELTAQQKQNDNKAVQVKLHTLPEETTFHTRMSFHNLKPVELGAICWALTWVGDKNLRHSLGMGKPFGFGQVEIAIDPATSLLRQHRLVDTKNQVTWEQYMQAFVEHMEHSAKEQKKAWKSSPQIGALLGMADPNKKPRQGSLQHMRLSTEQDNDFKKAKGDRVKKLPSLVLSEYTNGSHPTTGALPNQDRASSEWPGVEITLNPGNSELSATYKGKTAQLIGDAARGLRGSLPEDIQKSLKRHRRLEKCTIRVEPVGNRWKLVAILAVGETRIDT